MTPQPLKKEMTRELPRLRVSESTWDEMQQVMKACGYQFSTTLQMEALEEKLKREIRNINNRKYSKKGPNGTNGSR